MRLHVCFSSADLQVSSGIFSGACVSLNASFHFLCSEKLSNHLTIERQLPILYFLHAGVAYKSKHLFSLVISL